MDCLTQKDLKFKNERQKSYLFSLLILIFLWTDFTYLSKGLPNLEMSNSARIAGLFKKAMENGVIKPGTEKLYIWEKFRNANTEDTLSKALAEGYYFDFYSEKRKQIIFADSIYQGGLSFAESTFINFDRSKDQIVFIDKQIVDITNEYLKDSLKSFTKKSALQLTKADNGKYD